MTSAKEGKKPGIYVRFIRWFRNIPRRLSAIPESPHAIAKAFAVGVFVGILPGTGVAAALLVAFFLKMNKTAAVLGALMTNPWTVALFYAASYQVGVWFTRLEEPVAWRTLFTFREDWHGELVRVAPTMFIGAAVLGLALACCAYGIMRLLITGYRNSRLRHQAHDQ